MSTSSPRCFQLLWIAQAPDPEMVTVARRGIWGLALAINTLLPQATLFCCSISRCVNGATAVSADSATRLPTVNSA